MSILSDIEIIAKCTKPTGHMVPHDYEERHKEMPGYDPRINVVKDGDNFFDQYGRAVRPPAAESFAFAGRTGVLSSPYRTYVEGEIIGDWQPMIEPFSPSQVSWKGGHLIDGPEGWEDEPGAQFEQRSYRSPVEKIISYGTSSYGYDIRCGNKFKVFTNVHTTIVDPKNFDPKSFVEQEGDTCIIPPNSFALASSVEYVRIPRNILTVCLGKSTYARCGIIVNVTPLEPEWEGHITLEFSNTTNLPAKIYANEGIAQLLFLENERVNCRTSYKDRNGKYMNQAAEPIPPRV